MLLGKDNERLRVINQQLKANYKSQRISLQHLKDTHLLKKNKKQKTQKAEGQDQDFIV